MREQLDTRTGFWDGGRNLTAEELIAATPHLNEALASGLESVGIEYRGKMRTFTWLPYEPESDRPTKEQLDRARQLSPVDRLTRTPALSKGSQSYLALLDQMRELHLAKSAGYSGQGNPDAWSNFREAENWGSTALDGCFIRLGDKFRRAQNLRRDPSNDKVGEPLRDTLRDLASYALIAICLMDEEETNG